MAPKNGRLEIAPPSGRERRFPNRRTPERQFGAQEWAIGNRPSFRPGAAVSQPPNSPANVWSLEEWATRSRPSLFRVEESEDAE